MSGDSGRMSDEQLEIVERVDAPRNPIVRQLLAHVAYLQGREAYMRNVARPIVRDLLAGAPPRGPKALFVVDGRELRDRCMIQMEDLELLFSLFNDVGDDNEED